MDELNDGMTTESKLFSYEELLVRIEGHDNHLLLGNGFNRGLGIDTRYESIFNVMMDDAVGIYKGAVPLAEESNYDLETFIGRLEHDIADHNQFLKTFVRNKVKFDFMRATHKIVKSSIRNIYSENVEGVYILLSHFKKYFTLNYDPFLYLLLLRHKPVDTNVDTTVVLQPSLKFIQEDLDVRHNEIYSDIKKARDEGSLQLSGLGEEIDPRPLANLTKTSFVQNIKEYSKAANKGWTGAEIERVAAYILDEERENKLSHSVNDGFQGDLFNERPGYTETQNLFFLHGAFHIYKDGQHIRKITQRSDQALYDRLEKIINDEDRDIVCVFQNESKVDVLRDNKYLSKCLDRLGNIAGSLVIIGCSLSDNDDHIFHQIERSDVENVYVSCVPEKAEEIETRAMTKFPSKKVFLFDALTISYDVTGSKVS